MMNRLRKSLWMAALAVVLGTAASARADIELTLQEDNGTKFIVDLPAPNSGPVTFNGTFGTAGPVGTDFTIVASFGFSNSPGSATGITNSATVSIINNTAATHTLKIDVSAQGFKSPNSPPPLDVFDTVSGSLVNGSVTGTFQGTTDASNVLFGTGFQAPVLNFSASGPSQSFSANGVAHGFSPNGNTYSESIFSSFTLTGGSSLTLTGGNVQTVPTPAPAGLVLALTGFPLLGFAGMLRRRRKLA